MRGFGMRIFASRGRSEDLAYADQYSRRLLNLDVYVLLIIPRIGNIDWATLGKRF